VKANRIFATMCTPAGEGAPDGRWDTWRICEFAEILGVDPEVIDPGYGELG